MQSWDETARFNNLLARLSILLVRRPPHLPHLLLRPWYNIIVTCSSKFRKPNIRTYSGDTCTCRLWDKRSLHTRLYITIGCLLDCLYMNGILPSDSSSQIRECPALHDQKQCSEHHTLFPHTCGRVWTWDYFHIAPFKVHTVMKDVSFRPFCKQASINWRPVG